ncbi:MAG TPA: SLC13 family permease [Thermoguttaceae bacterium]|nr:SLC13 family permease [Thermoguttaceae bacterium]
MLNPLVILLIGVVVVVGMIIVLRVNAFIALITAAMVVSLLSAGELGEKISRVADAFGGAAAKIGIVIALAAVIGKCLMDSGAADRIVRSFLKLLGEKRSSWALMGSGFVLSIPVFFDTVFYLLVPLARSLWRSTRRNYVLYVTAIGCGAAITHTLVPPTPGPLIMAEFLHIKLGVMIMMGVLVGLPTAVVGLFVCRAMNRVYDIPMRPYSGETEPDPLADEELPPLWLSLLPIVLPVILICTNTVTETLLSESTIAAMKSGRVFDWLGWTAIFGDPNMALLLSAAVAMVTLVRYRRLSLKDLGKTTETALMSGGVIILITAGGGAFGAMLQQSGVKEYIEGSINLQGGNLGIVMLLASFGIAAVLKIAQGSSTVAMIAGSSMIAAMGLSSQDLGFDVVYLALAIGNGSLVGSWMNDSGFWIFARMSGFTEVETLKLWTVLLVIVALAGLGFTLFFAWLIPMA